MQFSRGLQIEKSLLAPTFYTDWLDRACFGYLSSRLCFCKIAVDLRSSSKLAAKFGRALFRFAV